MLNQSTPTEFLLLGFSDVRELQTLHFVVFLSIYLAALMGNVLLIITVLLDCHLHSPMYFFLVNLALSDVCYISTTIPKSLAVSLTNNQRISFSGCVSQVFLVVTFAGVDLTLLTAMAYDRYVAIRHPLQYTLIMNKIACLWMAAASWIISVLNAVMNTVNTFRLEFCDSHNIGQFFCDIPQLLNISCTRTFGNLILILANAVILCSSSSLVIIVSYSYIFTTVLKIPSVQARYKAFSTCTPHLTVFGLFVSTALFSYFRPNAWFSSSLDLLTAVFYTVLPPLMNPIIYSLRNKDIHTAVLKVLKTGISQTHFKKLSQRIPANRAKEKMDSSLPGPMLGPPHYSGC
ncbi:olfactory receptor 14A16-like [Tiliqua scincoides]|uniref:olfactory receptor 14A16-like n=1 Tax=Tiliqua scincoides TaxID=71010 RepID=UPI0034620CEC